MTNYRFKKEFENTTINLRAQKAVVNSTNLTDELAEIILNMPGISHNIELIPGRAVESKKKEVANEAGEVPLPESIVSALQEAGIEKKPLKEVPTKKESPSSTSKPLTAKPTTKKKGKR